MSEVAPETAKMEILNQVETVNRLYTLISEAERYVFLVSPYQSLDKLRTLVRHLQGALARKVQVKLVVRDKDGLRSDDSLGSAALRSLRDAGMEVRVLKDLHAKVYLSEKSALLTSLNLLESSFNNSIEVGTWLAADTPEYRKLVEFLRMEVQPTSVKVAALPEPAVLAAPPARSSSGRKSRRRAAPEEDDVIPFGDDEIPFDEDDAGHCIRCGEEVDFGPDKPLCGSCYGVWKRYGDRDYPEEYCHACGDESATSVAKPLCSDCYYSR